MNHPTRPATAATCGIVNHGPRHPIQPPPQEPPPIISPCRAEETPQASRDAAPSVATRRFFTIAADSNEPNRKLPRPSARPPESNAGQTARSVRASQSRGGPSTVAVIPNRRRNAHDPHQLLEYRLSDGRRLYGSERSRAPSAGLIFIGNGVLALLHCHPQRLQENGWIRTTVSRHVFKTLSN